METPKDKRNQDIDDKNKEPTENLDIPVYTQISENIKYKTKLVLSGGGLKGISHIGALYALEKIGCMNSIQEFAGTSAGSLVIALYLIGYSATELYDFIKLLNLEKLKNISILNIQSFGLDTGSRIEFVIKRLIKEKGHDENITLKDLYAKTNKMVTFITVCLNSMEICYVSHKTFPDLPLYLAIRMSLSIPFIYCPVIYKDNMYIDGACLDNYPITVFKDNLNETIGILLIDAKDNTRTIDNLETYILRVLECMMYGMTLGSKKGFENNTIEIHVESISIVNYEINNNKKDELFLKGYKAIMNNKDKLII
jgi:NTE family protein